ncbi:MAG: FAD-binding dehydrogenase [Gammaproteobacteria bacterium]|nr:MAG: FAD-binding dehydrogenase [Gammaproteobacteria bacterium]
MKNKADVIIIGAGISGLVCALESLRQGKKVIILDAQSRERAGGLARVAFGGMALIDTPEQKSKGIRDSAEIAFNDWCSFAEFGLKDHWPKQWAKYYTENSISEIYEYVKSLGLKFLPAVNWVERGLYTPGNSLPRYHILWGASLRLVTQLIKQLAEYENNLLTYQFQCRATKLIKTADSIIGCCATNKQHQEVEYYAEAVVVASGGFTGNLDKVRQEWPEDWGEPQAGLLNGTHPSNDGKMHDCVEDIGGQTSNMHNMWNYAAGIPNPNADFENHGLSLIPPRSAIWIDNKGHRIGPEPLVSSFDTMHMCRQINRLQIPHSWQIMNRRIALKELAISGSEHNTAIRDRQFITMLKEVLLGNKKLVDKMLRESDHFIQADKLEDLVPKMNNLTPNSPVSFDALKNTLDRFDQVVSRKESLWNDDQLRRIMSIRKWGTDKLRACYPKPIQGGTPLIAIKLNLITRKCLGGIKTDLSCRVLNMAEQPIKGLYAIGEASGFGGGGTNGKRSLEGTFLSGCILTARQAARSI